MVRDRLWAWGSYGRTDVNTPDARRQPRQDDARGHRRQAAGGLDNHAAAATSRSSAATRRRTVAAPAPSTRPRRHSSRMGRRRCTRGRSTSSRRARCSSPRAARTSTALHADAQGGPRQRPGVHRHRRRVPQQQVFSGNDRPQMSSTATATGSAAATRSGSARRCGTTRTIRSPVRRRLPGHPARCGGDTLAIPDPSVPSGQPRDVFVAVCGRPGARWTV